MYVYIFLPQRICNGCIHSDEVEINLIISHRNDFDSKVLYDRLINIITRRIGGTILGSCKWKIIIFKKMGRLYERKYLRRIGKDWYLMVRMHSVMSESCHIVQ